MTGINDNPSVSVNVGGARELHQQRYDQFTQGQIKVTQDGTTQVIKMVRARERLNVPLPCGCLYPIEDVNKYDKDGVAWAANAECEHGEWELTRKGGMTARRIR